MKQYKIAIDQNIFIAHNVSSAGSKMLEGFKPPYSAAVIEKLQAARMEICCHSKIGEFGASSYLAQYAAGGFADAAIGIDVEGSAFSSAIDNGALYIKPTYGSVSRYGVAANVSSMDQVGVYAKDADTAFAVLSIISGHDERDSTTYPRKKYEYSPEQIDMSGLKAIGFNSKCAKSDKYTDCEKGEKYLMSKTGITIKTHDFKYGSCLADVYAIISAAEFSGNISKFDGLKYGFRTVNYKNIDDIICNSRSEAFSLETKIKALTGAYVLSEGQFEKYYKKATQIRRLIKDELDKVFIEADFVILPILENAVNELDDYYNNLQISALANLTGCPAAVIPLKDVQQTIMVLTKEFNENKLFALCKALSL